MMVVKSLDEKLKEVDDLNIGKEKTKHLKRYVKFCHVNKRNSPDLKKLSALRREDIFALRKLQITELSKNSWDELYDNGIVHFCKRGHQVTIIGMIKSFAGIQKRDVKGWYCKTCDMIILKNDFTPSKIIVSGEVLEL